MLVYQDVVRKPNPMRNINPLNKTEPEIIPLSDRVDQLRDTNVWQKRVNSWGSKKVDMKRQPKVGMLKLGSLFIDELIQRVLSTKHCANRIAHEDHFDFGITQTLQCIKMSDGRFISIDGQHTATVLASMVEDGMIDADNWKDFEVAVQWIETDDFAFARRAFNLLNGKGKRKISAYQQLRNIVYINRVDGNTEDEDEVYLEKQVAIAEKYDCYPVEDKSPLLKYPGTFSNIANFLTLDHEESELACSWHNKFYHYDNIHVSLFFIFKGLSREYGSAKMKITDQLQTELAGLIQNLFGSLSQFAEATKEAHRRWGVNTYGYQPKWDDDAYMCGLMSLYQKFGGKENVPPTIIDRMNKLVNFYDDDILSLAA